jgi:hypothetical protein
MPAGDGTGPMGFGPMTGRGAGYCAGFPAPGYTNPMPGRGRGMGRGWGRVRGWGRGRGWGYGYYPMSIPGAAPVYGVPPYSGAPSGEQEAQALRTQAEHLEGALDDVKRRIAELEAAREQES